MKRYLAAAAGVALLAALAGCTAANTDKAAVAPDKPAAAAETPAAACETPSKALLSTIGSVLDTGVKAGEAAAVRSADFEKAWFVAVKLTGAGMAKAEPAVFVTNSLTDAGPLYAVGGTAHQFSDMGHGEDTDAGFSIGDDGFDAAVACVKDAS